MFLHLSVILFTGGSRRHPPSEQTPLPRSAFWEIRATSRRYASYWNAHLLIYALLINQSEWERDTCSVSTCRNEVVAKVIFLHLSAILFTGRGSASVHAGIPPDRHILPGSRHPPPEQTPPGPDTHPPEQTPPGADPPRADTPPQSRHPPPPYGQWAAGTHPTGMHSCYLISLVLWFLKQLKV